MCVCVGRCGIGVPLGPLMIAVSFVPLIVLSSRPFALWTSH